MADSINKNAEISLWPLRVAAVVSCRKPQSGSKTVCVVLQAAAASCFSPCLPKTQLAFGVVVTVATACWQGALLQTAPCKLWLEKVSGSVQVFKSATGGSYRKTLMLPSWGETSPPTTTHGQCELGVNLWELSNWLLHSYTSFMFLFSAWNRLFYWYRLHWLNVYQRPSLSLT